MCVCAHACMPAQCVCVWERACVYMCMCACMPAQGVYMCICVFVCTRERVYMCVCTHACTVCVHMRACMCVQACVYICMCPCMPACTVCVHAHTHRLYACTHEGWRSTLCVVIGPLNLETADLIELTNEWRWLVCTSPALREKVHTAMLGFWMWALAQSRHLCL